ncbi:MAG: SusC/RagA family TonB-linked outer membrane protein, partial [Paludibacter sp.]
KTLVVSFVGYQSQELTLGFQTDLMITLKEVNFGVDEVVVVGYGVQKKVAITAAVSSVGSEEIMKSSSADLTNALSGKLTGLSALQNGGGQPGKDDATIYLRGISTLNGASPLVLIDGVPRDNMRAIDANEVESVSILKDASATAVFGVRGANGVIMITTKRGKEGKAQLGINIEQNFTSFTREPKRIHSVEYMQLRNLALTNDGLPAAFSEETIAKFRDPLAGLDKNAPDYEEQKALRNYIYCDHDYYREFIKRYTPQTRASVDVSGGTKDISYFLNAGFLHQGGNLNSRPKSELGFDPASYMNRFTFRSNLDYKVTNSLSLFLNLGTYIERVNMPLGNPIVTFIVETIQLSPITPGPKSIDGYGVPGGIIVHPGQNHDVAPYEVLNGRGYQMDCRSNLNSTFGGVWDLSNAITPGLSLKGMVSYDSYQGSTIWGSTSFPTVYSHIDYNTDNLIFSYKSDVGSPLSIGKSMLTSYNVNMQGSLNYNRRFNKHEVTGLLLCQRDFWDAGAEIPHNVIGFVGRMLYNYDNKYFAEYDIGYNGSEQFGPGHRFGFFPAVSAGWVVSNENFLKDSRVINNLKLRLSYGKVGNDRISSDRFLYLDNITLGNGFLGSLGNGQQVNEGLVGNPNISWEIAKKKNMGVDFVLFKNLSGTFDLFDERRSDILVQRSSVPAFQGVDPGYALSGKIPKANMGVVHNRGFEAELDYSLPVTKDLSFRFRGNFSYAHNTIKESDEVPLDETYVCRYRRMGNPVGQEFGFLIDWDDHGGYWISQDQINSSGLKYEFGQPRVGDFKYIDENEDGVINDKDQVPVGYSSVVPEILYGFSLGAKYKNFDFSVFFQGVGRYSKYLNFQNVWECFGDGTYYDYHMNSWTLDRYLNGSKITHPALSTKENTNHVKNAFFIMSCAYTR